MKSPKWNLLKLEKYRELRDQMVHVIWGKLVSHYQRGLCNPFSKVSYNLLFFNSLDLDVGGSMSQENGQDNSWNNTCVTYQVAIIITSKLPLNWLIQSLIMAYKVDYFIKTYSIPLALVVNNYQIGVHLVPNDGERTWESKGTKHVQVLGLEDEKKVMLVVWSSTIGNLLPPQIMFIGFTPRTLPPNNNDKTSCINDGWDLTFSENHWSSLEITKHFVKKILLPYL